MMTYREMCVVALLCFSGMTTAISADQPVIAGRMRLNPSSLGEVAMRTLETNEWQLLEPGDEAAQSCELRTSAFGVARFEVADGRLAFCDF